MRADEVKPLQPLRDEQLQASDPAGDVWLSASAGTGKTHVLTARVLRLLLRPGLDPSTILCLTFTKAGAAEMAERVQSRLARWVRLDEAALKKELFSLGETHDEPAVIARARTLFARVLEVPGGLRIGTIHAFAGSLLASFPVEAGLTPGFRPMEAREEALLARQTLAELVLAAEKDGDDTLIEALSALGLRLGEGGAEAWLRRCAQALDVLDALPADIRGFVGEAMELPPGDVADAIAAACGRHPLDGALLDRLRHANHAWGTETGLKHADAIDRWRGTAHGDRGGLLGAIRAVVRTTEGALRKASAKLLAHEPDYEMLAEELGDACARLEAMREQAALADLLSAGLEAGRRYARAYAAAKRSAGLVDFNDLIQRVGRLLEDPSIGAWIRYMLDQATDHILVDEGQDTNARQWAIVKALAAEYFTGAGARSGRVRTLFTVGDHKQAIFGFQGTDPLFFRAAEERFASLAAGLDPADAGKGPMARLSLNRSFRSAPPVLDVVDALIDEVGPEALGLFDAPPRHESAIGGAGAVELWPAVGSQDDDDTDAGGDEEGWIGDATRRLATRIADQIAAWLRDGLWLSAKNRPIEAQDIMILVRRRGDLASLLVARLHAAKVPVAGVDRLRLSAPLAVQDLLAAARFAAQPEDSLTLASLLVSPLVGWDQDRLAQAARRPAGVSLWRHLRDNDVPDELTAILAMADLVTPYAFFERILSGPMQGRRRLLARLGPEAADPIDELLNAALQFERTGTPGLQRFLDWFDRDDVEIVRDPSAPLDAVRVMTVHGAKGLQAPVVILADATVDPERSPRRELLWQAGDLLDPLPVFRPRRAELAGSLLRDAQDADRRDRQEHWRLLYVAATRAEERLVIAGALGPAARGTPPANSWYAAVARALGRVETVSIEDDRWGTIVAHRIEPATRRGAKATEARAPVVARPAWLDRSAPEEARPARPLSPSAPSEDDAPNPPPSAAMQAAAARGRLLHALFERLPEVPVADRRARADAWLSGSGGVFDPAERARLIDDVLAVVEDPAFADLFGPDGLAEAPLAAVVDGIVVAGTVDRLRVAADRVTVVDFKTGRRVPAGLDQVPDAHLRQMGAYAAALRVIFPDRAVTAALLYTGGPAMITVDDAVLARFHPARLSQGAGLPT